MKHLIMILALTLSGCATVDYRYELQGVNGQTREQLLEDKRRCVLATAGQRGRPGSYLNTPANACMRQLGYEIVAVEVK